VPQGPKVVRGIREPLVQLALVKRDRQALKAVRETKVLLELLVRVKPERLVLRVDRE